MPPPEFVKNPLFPFRVVLGKLRVFDDLRHPKEEVGGLN
jgi:hypothetical protein